MTESTPRAKNPAAARPAMPGGRGRSAKRVFINVSVRESTRKAMNVLTRRHGITQGELLDLLLTGRMRIGG